MAPTESHNGRLGPNQCGFCGAEANVKCGGCRVREYCSKECQKKRWPIHKTPCRDLGLQQMQVRQKQKQHDEEQPKEKPPGDKQEEYL